jgi:hypothetical protein
MMSKSKDKNLSQSCFDDYVDGAGPQPAVCSVEISAEMIKKNIYRFVLI